MMFPWANNSTSRYLLVAALLLVSLGRVQGQPAQLQGNVLLIPVVTFEQQAYALQLTVVDGSDPLRLTVTAAQLLVDADISQAASFDGQVLSLPVVEVSGVTYWAEFNLLAGATPSLVLSAAGTVGPDVPPQNCVRPEPDPSNGPDNPTITDGFLVPPDEVVDGGPGPDGIPAIESPLFTRDYRQVNLLPEDLVVGVKLGDMVRAYPHRYLDYHEIVNDRYEIGGGKADVTLSYCPLTGSAVLWRGFEDVVNASFGVSGLLHNSNLILYDRETGSLWSQMLEQAIRGPELARLPDKLQIIETTWETWLSMYPQTWLLHIEEDEFSFPYEFYPYGLYRGNDNIIYPVSDLADDRLHRKERVLGVTAGEHSKVYPINSFGGDTTVRNDRVGNLDVVAAGSASRNFGVVFNRQLEDCTVLEFGMTQEPLPALMSDNEGNVWDIFGVALSGPREGAQLQKTNSLIAYWFAWAAFFPGAEIHQ